MLTIPFESLEERRLRLAASLMYEEGRGYVYRKLEERPPSRTLPGQVPDYTAGRQRFREAEPYVVPFGGVLEETKEERKSPFVSTGVFAQPKPSMVIPREAAAPSPFISQGSQGAFPPRPDMTIPPVTEERRGRSTRGWAAFGWELLGAAEPALKVLTMVNAPFDVVAAMLPSDDPFIKSMQDDMMLALKEGRGGEALGKAREIQQKFPLVEQMVRYAIVDPTILMGVPMMRTALPKAAEAFVASSRGAGAVAKKVAPVVERLATEEAGFAKIPGKKAPIGPSAAPKKIPAVAAGQKPFAEAAPAAAKEPWQMTRAEWRGSPRGMVAELTPAQWRLYKDDERWIAFAHENLIHNALTGGKPVPAEVLRDYPNLVPAAKPQAPAAGTLTRGVSTTDASKIWNKLDEAARMDMVERAKLRVSTVRWKWDGLTEDIQAKLKKVIETTTEPAGVAGQPPRRLVAPIAEAPVTPPRAAAPPQGVREGIRGTPEVRQAAEEARQVAQREAAAAGGGKPPVQPPISVTPPEPLPTGKPGKSLEQADEALARFTKFLTSPETENAWDMTVQLRKEALGQRIARFQARAEELVVQGKSTEDAITQATRETMSGTLPSTTADLTTELRDALFAKVYHTLQDEPFEMISTSEALTNALLGKPIPRIPGTAGGSAYTRLLRVFGDTPEVVEKLTAGKKIEDLVEEAVFASAKKPQTVDQELFDYLRSLPTIPHGQAGLGEGPFVFKPLMPRGTPLEQAEALVETVRATYPNLRQLPIQQRESLLTTLRQTGISEADFGRIQLRLWPDAPVRPLADFPQLPNIPYGQARLGEQPFVFGQLSARGTLLEEAESLIATVKATYPDIRTLPEADRAVLLQTLRSTGVNETDLGRLQLDLWPGTPPRPVPVYEAPIEAAVKQPSLMPLEAEHQIIAALKEAGMTAVDIGNFLRANKASVDFSFWRQAFPLILNNKRPFIKGNVAGWRGMWNGAFAKQSYRDILNHPLYAEYDYLKLDFLRPGEMPSGALRGRGVEEFGYLTADRPIPAFTAELPHVKVSQRGFVSALNTMLWEMFQNHYKDMLKVNEGIAAGTIKMRPGKAFSIHNEMRLYGEMLEDFSGRASLGKARELAPALSGLIFAPRYALGRLISPRHLFSGSKYVRAAAWKNAASAVGGFGSIIVLGERMNLWDVEWDPRSSDFAKIRIGNTRIDPWGGYQQFARFFAQAATNTGISGVTGAPYKLDPLQALTRFMRGKAAPLASLVADLKTGKTYVGDNVNLVSPKQWIDRVTPMLLMDIYEAVKDAGPLRGAIVAGPAAVGAGVATYGSVAQTTNRSFNEAFPLLERLGIYLGEVPNRLDMQVGVKGGEVELTPEQRDLYQRMMANRVMAAMKEVNWDAMEKASGIIPRDAQRRSIEKRIADAKDKARETYRNLLESQGVKPKELVGAGAR